MKPDRGKTNVRSPTLEYSQDICYSFHTPGQ